MCNGTLHQVHSHFSNIFNIDASIGVLCHSHVKLALPSYGINRTLYDSHKKQFISDILPLKFAIRVTTLCSGLLTGVVVNYIVAKYIAKDKAIDQSNIFD